jgi:hypothetical protein
VEQRHAAAADPAALRSMATMGRSFAAFPEDGML